MPRRSTHRITDRFIKSADIPAKGYRVYYDADLPGFGCRVSSSGGQAFVLNYLVDGRERRITIGRYPTWSSTAAREQAKALKRKIDIGVDPLEVRDQREVAANGHRSAPSISDLFDRYASEHLPRKNPRSAADDRSMWVNEILPRIGDIKVIELTHDEVDALHADISKDRPIRANRIIEVLRKALNLSIRWGWRTSNPASGVHKNSEEKRERFLSDDEVGRLRIAIAREPDRDGADAIELLLLTGSRKSEVLMATWDEFSLDDGIWIKPSAHTKQKREHRLPLSEDALGILRYRYAQRVSGFVFPGKDPEKPLHDLRNAWRRICIEAGLAKQVPQKTKNGEIKLDTDGNPLLQLLPTVRIHDLRHTYASVLASSGFSLPIIGALLGHTQTQTTARYAHLLDESLREAVGTAAKRIGSKKSQYRKQ